VAAEAAPLTTLSTHSNSVVSHRILLGLVGAETGSANLLRMAGHAPQITIDKLTPRGDAGRAIGEGFALAVVEIGGEPTQLVVSQ
jgi:hypothetical protein